MILAASAEFKLSITKALTDQLGATLAPLSPAPLTAANLAVLNARPGVYELFLQGQRVYVGKAARSLPDRLSQHLRKISGRTNIDLDDMSFVAVYVDEDLDAAAPEKLLIKKYQHSGDIPWNSNGFGNKDPGRKRDQSMVKAAHFDAHYPINLNFPFEITPGDYTAAALLKEAKALLPFTFRFEQKKKGATKIYKDTVISVLDEIATVQDLVARLVETLPGQWQATALPGYMILYPELAAYESALMWWRRGDDGTVAVTQGPQHFAGGDVMDEGADDED
ncbi:Eco29kI family restriction endonuclease [Nonomuraea zeae]|uniref:Eco29kI family restriction endonuclease n=1 Tax=Nonomuraea zeae TaxID=1642303 RepID=A0A5S4H1Q1_9ACTN|nr:Eco29kI family restriction endonuclease [Nonomuraea zeae]TMR38842.1 Eco29kI family restriction endonuclease [Nonomuraea zeae]